MECSLEFWAEVSETVWGNTFNEEIFRSWIGGFCVSKDCAAALVQFSGGPCAVLAPLQAFIVKHLLSSSASLDIGKAPENLVEEALVTAVEEIIRQASRQNQIFKIVVKDEIQSENGPDDYLTSFHKGVHVHTVQSCDLNQFLKESLTSFRGDYGILCMLYTVLLSHGVEALKNEMSDASEPLIEPQHGHGSQALINLFLTGRAVSYVWDGDKDLDGFLLRGVDCQSEIGYLSILERLRYIEVGTHLKSPKNPIWVVSSEMHLSVLFSTEKALVCKETDSEKACRIFQSHDPEGGSFISVDKLGDVLEKLGLESDPEYVNLMKSRLDTDGLGIILLPAFMEEYFPKQTSSVPDVFSLFHWNGIRKSNRDDKVTFKHGSAILLETNLSSSSDSDRLRMVLQTKWPRIDINWDFGPPSID